MRLIPIRSSMLAALGYEPSTETMVVQFQNGDLYRYNGVPSETFVAVITNQKSSGKAFIEMVKNRAFAFTKVKPDEVVGL